MAVVDSKDFNKMLRDLEVNIVKAWQDTGTFFKNTTPVRSGNARSRTRTVGKKISGDYAYAGRLDEGWSKQAPNGMSDPSLEYFEKEINNIVRKYG